MKTYKSTNFATVITSLLMVLFIILPLQLVLAQGNKKSNEPKGKIRIIKEYDGDGNLLRVDTLCNFYYSDFENFEWDFEADSLLNNFKFFFSEKSDEGTFFKFDSLFAYRFYDKDFFDEHSYDQLKSFDFPIPHFDNYFMYQDSLFGKMFDSDFFQFDSDFDQNEFHQYFDYFEEHFEKGDEDDGEDVKSFEDMFEEKDVRKDVRKDESPKQGKEEKEKPTSKTTGKALKNTKTAYRMKNNPLIISI